MLATAVLLAALIGCAIAADLVLSNLGYPPHLRWWEMLGYAAAFVFILLLVVVGGVLVLRATRPKATLVVDDSGRISVHRNNRRGDPEVKELVALDQVAAITWYIDLFDPSGTELLQFWDRNPQLRMDLLGIMPSEPGVVPLAEIPRALIAASPSAELRLRIELSQRIESGAIYSNVDVATWEPIGEKLPPLAPGASFEGRNVIRRPVDPEETDQI